MTNVLIATDAFLPSLGGIEKHVVTIASEFHKYGLNPIILSSVTKKRLQKAQEDGTMEYIRAQGKGKFHVIYFVVHRIGGWSFIVPTLMRSTFDLLTRFNIKLVHCHNGYSPVGFMAAICATARGIPCIYTNHSAVKPSFWANVFGLFQHFTYKRCDKVVCVSKHSEDMLQGVCGRLKNVCVIPNPVVFPPPKANIHAKSVTKVLWSARISMKKGLKALTMLANRLQHSSILLTIITTRAQKVSQILYKNGFKGIIVLKPLSVLLNMTQNTRTDNCIYMAPMVPPNVFSQCLHEFDIVVTTSYTESFSLVAAEAIAANIPVVGYKCIGLYETYSAIHKTLADCSLTTNFVTSARDTVREENVNELYNIILKTISTYDDPTYVQMRQEAQKHVKELFSTDVHMSKLIPIYRELIQRNEGAVPLAGQRPVLEWSWVWLFCLLFVYLVFSVRKD